MTATEWLGGGRSNSRGHDVIYDEVSEQWVYEDDLSSASYERPCIRCGKMPTADGHDACIANLPGVINACCGHGIDEPYVMFKDKTVLRGEKAEKWIKENNGGV